jgi:hypothetical protein
MRALNLSCTLRSRRTERESVERGITSAGRTEVTSRSAWGASVERAEAGSASTRIDFGVSDLSAFRTSACARRSRFRQRAQPGHGHLGAHLGLVLQLRANDLGDDQALAPSGKTAKLPHGQRVCRLAA